MPTMNAWRIINGNGLNLKDGMTPWAIVHLYNICRHYSTPSRNYASFISIPTNSIFVWHLGQISCDRSKLASFFTYPQDLLTHL
jgi:hypothetical protein